MIRSTTLTAWLLGAMLLSPAVAIAAQAPDATEEDAAEQEPLVGLLLGRIFLRDFRAAEGTKLRLSFALYTEVSADNVDATNAFIAERQHRIRDAIITATRTAPQAEFQDPALDRFRRRLMMRLRRVVPTLEIRRLLIGEFEFLVD